MTLPADYLDFPLVDLPDTPEVNDALFRIAVAIWRKGEQPKGTRFIGTLETPDFNTCTPLLDKPVRLGPGFGAGPGGPR